MAFFLVVIQAAIRMRKRRSPFETATLVGKEGRVVKALEPTGVILVGAEEWTAQAIEGAIAAGARVRVVSVDGLRLSVAEVHDPREAVTPISGWGNLPGLDRGRDMSNLGFLIALGVVVLIVLIILINAIKIVREYQRLVVFRLGRALGVRGPGLVILIPIIDRVSQVDLRELYLEIPHQDGDHQGQRARSLDFIIFYKVVDASMSCPEVAELRRAPPRTSPRPRCERGR